MLPRAHRLTREKDFSRVHKTGEKLRGRFVFCKVAPNALEVPRFGFLIGKTFDKRAVVRNRVRRQVREAIRLLLQDDSVVLPAVDVAVMVQPRVREATQQELLEDLRNVFDRYRAAVSS